MAAKLMAARGADLAMMVDSRPGFGGLWFMLWDSGGRFP